MTGLLALFGLALLLPLGVGTTPASAQPRWVAGNVGDVGVPEPLRGAWFAGPDCAAPEAMLFVTARAVARLPADGAAKLLRFEEVREATGWTLGVAGGAEAPRALLRAAGEALEEVEPDAKTRDDRLPGEAPVTRWQRCPAAPSVLAALHGEGLAFLVALEHIEAACAAGDAAGCARAVLAQADVTRDGLLTVAEIGRLVRGAAWLAAATEDGDAMTFAAATGVGALGGVAVARVIVESLDYDGDGKLSLAELVQDRAPLPGAGGTPAGRPLRLDGVGSLRGLIEGLAEGR